jgi:hypothetical protein
MVDDVRFYLAQSQSFKTNPRIVIPQFSSEIGVPPPYFQKCLIDFLQHGSINNTGYEAYQYREAHDTMLAEIEPA